MWERSGLNCSWVDEEKTNKEKTKQRETNFKKKAKQGEEWWGKVNFREKRVKSIEQGERRDRR
jgi:hypothetical protein